MAPVLSGALLFTCTAVGILAQAPARSLQASAPLQHAGEDCLNACWKTAGFCEWCGVGNSCCRADEASVDGACKGDSPVTAPLYQCSTAAFLPGDAPPAPGTGSQAVIEQAQCISEMAKEGCGWTQEFSCPGQTRGWKGVAKDDGKVGYKCCCTNNLWRQSATRGAALPASSGLVSRQQCAPYMAEEGCGWTAKFACPGQVEGTDGLAANDGTLGYKCCCLNAMWQTGALLSTTAVPLLAAAGDPNAFNVDHVMAPSGATLAPTAGPTLVPTEIDNGYAVNVATGEQHGTNINVPTVPTQNEERDEFLYGHTGANVHVTRMHVVNPAFTPSAHHGPIHNELSGNAKKERCTFGICTDLESEGGTASTLPSYSVSVDGTISDPTLNVQEIGGVTTVVATVAPAVAANATAAPPPVVANFRETEKATKEEIASGSGSLTTSSGGVSGFLASSGPYGPLIAIAMLCVGFILISLVVVGLMSGRKKKRQTTDREQYLKNDFIERQPVYHEVGGEPADGATDEEQPLREQEFNEPRPQEVVPALEPTPSFPMQQVEMMPALAPIGGVQMAQMQAMAPASTPVTAPSGISFPGMPTIGANGMPVQQAGSMYQQYTMPPVQSMNTTLPYGQYASPSTYVTAPAAYNQLGMTGPLTSVPQAGSQYMVAAPQIFQETAPQASQYVMR